MLYYNIPSNGRRRPSRSAAAISPDNVWTAGLAHSHSHHHPHAHHPHAHPAQPAPWSVFGLGVTTRLLIAAGASALLWAAVWGAMQ